MVGLRTQESEKFNRFFTLVQSEAQKRKSVFFADAGDGNEFETDSMEGEEIMGWLIPEEKATEFEPIWKHSQVDDTWSAFFTWAVWKRNNETITVDFEG